MKSLQKIGRLYFTENIQRTAMIITLGYTFIRECTFLVTVIKIKYLSSKTVHCYMNANVYIETSYEDTEYCKQFVLQH